MRGPLSGVYSREINENLNSTFLIERTVSVASGGPL